MADEDIALVERHDSPSTEDETIVIQRARGRNLWELRNVTLGDYDNRAYVEYVFILLKNHKVVFALINS